MAGWRDVVGGFLGPNEPRLDCRKRCSRQHPELLGVSGPALDPWPSLARCRGPCRLCCLLRSAGLREVPRGSAQGPRARSLAGASTVIRAGSAPSKLRWS